MITTEKELLDKIDHYFLTEPKLSYARIFAREQCSVEGWFKGELLYLFTSLAEEKQLPGWKSEETVLQNKKADFIVTINSHPVYLELKAFPRKKMAAHFTEDLVYGITRDVRKLAEVGQGFCLLFIYPAPTQQDWKIQLGKYNQVIGAIDSSILVTDERAVHDEQSPLYIARLSVTHRS
jgi:hypothetical protein